MTNFGKYTKSKHISRALSVHLEFLNFSLFAKNIYMLIWLNENISHPFLFCNRSFVDEPFTLHPSLNDSTVCIVCAHRPFHLLYFII